MQPDSREKKIPIFSNDWLLLRPYHPGCYGRPHLLSPLRPKTLRGPNNAVRSEGVIPYIPTTGTGNTPLRRVSSPPRP